MAAKIDHGPMPDRLTRLRQAHEVLAHELGSAQRRLFEREREIRELRAALDAYRGIRAPRGSARPVVADTAPVA